MRLEDLESLDAQAIEARWEEVLSFIRAAGNLREVAAGCRAMGLMWEKASRFEEAWFAYDQAARHYEACGLEEEAAAARKAARALLGRAFPPFANEEDLWATFDRLGMELLRRGQKWCGATPSEGAVAKEPLLEREVFRRRLEATLNSGAHMVRPCAAAKRLSLDPSDVEILLLLHRIETDSRWDRAVRSLGREEFLPTLSVRLLCRFLSGDGVVRWAWLSRLEPSAPLLRLGLVERFGQDGDRTDDGRAPYVRLGVVVAAFLSGAAMEDVILASGAVLERPDPTTGPLADSLISTWVQEEGQGCLLLSGGGLQELARAVGRPLVRIDVTVGDPLSTKGALTQGLLAAALTGSLPVVVVLGQRRWSLRGPEGDTGQLPRGDVALWFRDLAPILESYGAKVALVAPGEFEAEISRCVEGLVVFRVPRPSPAKLAARLQASLELRGVPKLDEGLLSPALTSDVVDEDSIEDLAREVAALYRSSRTWDGAVVGKVVRLRASSAFLGIAERLVTRVGWEDLILPDELLVTLNEIITFARYRDRVMVEWGFAEKMPYGRAISALFQGPPGTGKTLAACVLANELGVDVYRVDLSQVVSKWVGETEKNLARVFDAASRTRALVLFDEADSLFGKRTEVRTAVDRYSNLEVNYLLQRLEDFDGVIVLTTNYPENIDQAFKRRIRFKVTFPFPDAKLRTAMWRTLIPRRVPREGVIKFEELGESFEFTGAHIKNAILRATFRAAAEDRGLTHLDLLEAARAEAKEAGILVRK